MLGHGRFWGYRGFTRGTKSYYQEIIAPIFDEEHHYIYNQKNRKIRVYQQLNNYFVIEDMLSKIELFASEGKRWHF